MSILEQLVPPENRCCFRLFSLHGTFQWSDPALSTSPLQPPFHLPKHWPHLPGVILTLQTSRVGPGESAIEGAQVLGLAGWLPLALVKSRLQQLADTGHNRVTPHKDELNWANINTKIGAFGLFIGHTNPPILGGQGPRMDIKSDDWVTRPLPTDNPCEVWFL